MGKAKASVQSNAPVLRVAAAWGTTILAVKILEQGQDCTLGEGPDGIVPKPDMLEAPAVPLRAIGGGWELDARGVISGVLLLRGREEDVVAMARSGAPVPVVPGDYGLLQYGLFSIFFQYTAPARPIAQRLPFDLLVGLSLFSSVVFHLGIIGLLVINWTPPEYHLPPELVPDFAAQFHLNKELPEWDQARADKKDEKGGGKGVKDPGAHDTKKQGGGQKMAGKEGRAGLNGKEDRTELQGEIRPTTNYGGLSEALADTGIEIKNTLKQIQSVSEALGGLNSDNVVLGSGPGTGLHGAGAGGGGNGAGVMFGSGTMSTGFGPGMGGGFGAGGGGAGGRGTGGFGAGSGNGTGNGAGNGPGEHGVGGAGGGGVAHGGLTADQINRVVQAHRGALQACYEIEAEKDPTLRGGLTVSWTIDPSGSVTSASLAGTTIHNARVEGCVLRQVRAWHFPASDSPSQPTYPFRFAVGH